MTIWSKYPWIRADDGYLSAEEIVGKPEELVESFTLIHRIFLNVDRCGGWIITWRDWLEKFDNKVNKRWCFQMINYLQGAPTFLMSWNDFSVCVCVFRFFQRVDLKDFSLNSGLIQVNFIPLSHFDQKKKTCPGWKAPEWSFKGEDEMDFYSHVGLALRAFWEIIA